MNKKRSVVFICSFVAVLFSGVFLFIRFGPSIYKAENILPDYGVNMVDDSGFENSSKWTNIPQNWQIATDYAHTGNQSLKYSNDDPTFYKFPGINLPLSHGDIYTISVWAKTENLVCDASGPGADGVDFDIEWWGVNNKWLGGGAHSHARPMGTQDWTQLTASTPALGFDVTRISANFFIKKGCTGTAWYDDIEIKLSDGTIFRPQVSYPNYRNTFLSNQPRDLKFDVEYRGTDHAMTDGNNVAVELKNSNENIIWQSNQSTASSKQRYSFSTDLSSAPPGDYTLITNIKNPSNNIILSKSSTLTIDANNAPLPKVYVDQYNRTIKDGQLYFPLGVYCGVLSTDVMDKINYINFNTAISYSLPYGLESSIRGTLDQANDHKISVLYNLVGTQYPSDQTYAQKTWTSSQDGLVNGGENIMKAMVKLFKTYPALFGWYTNDELGEEYLNQLQTRNNYIQANDFNHPTWTVLYTGQNYAKYLNTADVMGVDSYPIWGNRSHPNDPVKFEVTGQASKAVNDASFGTLPYWLVPEANVTNETGVRPASYTEMLNSAFQGLVNGARGLIYYNISHVIENTNSATILNDMKNLGTYINKMSSVTLGINASSDKQLTASNAKVSLLTRTVGNDVYVMAVNPYNETISTVYTIPSAVGLVNNISIGLPGESTGILSVLNNQFSDQIEPLGTRLYKLNISDSITLNPIKVFTYKDKTIISGEKTAQIAHVTVNGTEATLDNVRNAWSIEIGLTSGQNTINILAQDQNDNFSSTTLVVIRRKLADANNDLVVNDLDFTLLLYNWGIMIQNNIADFNEDGKVDDLDFTILLYWMNHEANEN